MSGGPRPFANRGVYNLGMGIPQDRQSKVINDGSWVHQPDVVTYTGGGGGEPNPEFSHWAWLHETSGFNGNGGFSTNGDTWTAQDGSTFTGPTNFGGSPQQEVRTPQPDVFQSYQETPEEAQRRAGLQNAYNTTQMSGYQGGVINSAYATPQTGNPFQVNDPSAPGASMPWNQPWGQPGYGGPTGGTSTGGFGAPTQGFGQGSMPQGSGWGGVFSQKNPWAAS
jgi:hypothetical protein